MKTVEISHRVDENEACVTRGLNGLAPSAAELIALMRVLRDRAQLSVVRRSVDPLMDYLYENLSNGVESVAEVPIACARGCAHCCHTWIEATPPEVFFTVKKIPAAQLESVRASVLKAFSQTEGMTLPERTKLIAPCPLLVEGACSVYPMRPVACRLAVSASADACLRSFIKQRAGSIPVPAPWGPLRQGYRIALEAALLSANLDWGMTEWNSALHTVLDDPSSEANWLNGERVFAELQRMPRRSVFAIPSWAELYREAFGKHPLV